MKNFKIILVSLSTAALMIAMALSFNACTEQSPLQPVDNTLGASLNKPAAGAYPQYAERIYRFTNKEQEYSGGNMKVNGGTTFHLEAGALTPPPGTRQRQRVTLTMLVERDKFRSELIFTFGPSGCTFDPPAEVWFDWKDLHSENATLYYIDSDGNYIPQTPDYVDSQGQRIKLFIDHFSRYAIGTE